MRTTSSSGPWRGHVDAHLPFMSCCVDGFCGQALSHHIVLSMRGSVDGHCLFHLGLCGWVLWIRMALSSCAVLMRSVDAHSVIVSWLIGCVNAQRFFVSSVEMFCGCVSRLHVVLSEWVLWTGNVSSHGAVYEGICGCAPPHRLVRGEVMWMRIASSCRAV